MPSAKQLASEYQPKELMGNIAELESVPVVAEFYEKEFTRKDGSAFKVLVYEFEGKDYRVPTSVLEGLKAVLLKRPKLQNFCVSKTGSTKEDTKYTVVAMD